MNVHILKDEKLSQNIYNEVIETLQSFNNPLIFLKSTKKITLDEIDLESETMQEEDFNRQASYSSIMHSSFSIFPIKRKVAQPKDILKTCYEFRREKDIGDDDFVILLTEKANNLNWFSFGDYNNNAFIHCSDWGYYLGCNSSYPISYEIIVNIYYMILFEDINDIRKHTHKIPEGCINDFCKQKKDIKLKMRTADICSVCQNLMIKRNFPMAISTQMFEIMEHLRTKMIALERFARNRGASKVDFRGYTRRFFLTDLDDLEIKLTPLEKTVYHMFINHPEGIIANCITDFKQELHDLYTIFYNGDNLANFKNSINNLCDYFNPSMQEKISSIKRKITNSVGSNMAKYYIIEKDNTDDKYKIKLDRNLISFVQSN